MINNIKLKDRDVKFRERHSERERERERSPSIPTLSFVSLSSPSPSLPPPSPPFFLPASHFSFSTLSCWHGPAPHVGISYSDHFQLMSPFISRERSNSGGAGGELAIVTSSETVYSHVQNFTSFHSFNRF